MILDVKKLFGSSQVINLDYSINLSEFEYLGSCPFITPVKITGSIKCSDGIVVVKAFADFSFSMLCDRCSELFSKGYHIEIFHDIVSSLNDQSNNDLILAENNDFDLDELIISDILLYLPIKNLCSESCKGICTKCGRNLNREECFCKPETDSRFDILKQLLD